LHEWLNVAFFSHRHEKFDVFVFSMPPTASVAVMSSYFLLLIY